MADERRWFSLTESFTSRTDDDPSKQRRLRDDLAERGVAEFARIFAEGRLPHETWREHAACKGQTELFFPRRADETHERFDPTKEVARVEFGRPQRLDDAREVCRSCPVRPECLAWGLRIGGSDKHAILGGTTPNQRKQIGTWLRIELQGGHPLISRMGWAKYRRTMRAVRAGLTRSTEPQGDDIVFDD